MPTAHRVACLRDDAVFLVFLYQRWCYPVDKKRANEYGIAYEREEGEEEEERAREEEEHNHQELLQDMLEDAKEDEDSEEARAAEGERKKVD